MPYTVEEPTTWVPSSTNTLTPPQHSISETSFADVPVSFVVGCGGARISLGSLSIHYIQFFVVALVHRSKEDLKKDGDIFLKSFSKVVWVQRGTF